MVLGVDSLGNRLQVARRRGADHTIESSRIDPVDKIITLCPGGEERLRRLMSAIQLGRVDLSPLVNTVASSITSRRPMTCPCISTTACSRRRSRPDQALLAGAACALG